VIPKDTRLARGRRRCSSRGTSSPQTRRSCSSGRSRSSPPTPPTATTRSAGHQALRRPRQARQHARHLHQRRQRHQCRGRAAGHAERGRILQRPEQAAGRGATEVLRRLGHRADLQPHVGRLVVGLRHAVCLVQAERLGARRHQPEHGGVVPARIKDKGALREQFVHVIDVVPTILEAASIRAPDVVDGISRRRSKAPASPTHSTPPTPRRHRGTRRSTSR